MSREDELCPKCYVRDPVRREIKWWKNSQSSSPFGSSREAGKPYFDEDFSSGNKTDLPKGHSLRDVRMTRKTVLTRGPETENRGKVGVHNRMYRRRVSLEGSVRPPWRQTTYELCDLRIERELTVLLRTDKDEPQRDRRSLGKRLSERVHEESRNTEFPWIVDEEFNIPVGKRLVVSYWVRANYDTEVVNFARRRFRSHDQIQVVLLSYSCTS